MLAIIAMVVHDCLIALWPTIAFQMFSIAISFNFLIVNCPHDSNPILFQNSEHFLVFPIGFIEFAVVLILRLKMEIKLLRRTLFAKIECLLELF